MSRALRIERPGGRYHVTARGNERKCIFRDGEQRQFRALARSAGWSQIVSAVEKTKGEKWAEFNGRYGDWGRDAALWLGRRRGRLSPSELGKLAGGMDYAAVGQAVSRFGKRIEKEAALRRKLTQIESKLSNVGTRAQRSRDLKHVAQ